MIFNPSIVVFNISFVLVLLTFIQARFLGCFGQQFTYSIFFCFITGLSLGGAYLARGKRTLLAYNLGIRLASIFFVFSTVISSLVLPKIVYFISGYFPNISEVIKLFGLLPFLTVPYFFGGWILSSILRDYINKIQWISFSGASGFSVGLAMYIFVLHKLGLSELVFLASVLIILPSMFAGVTRQQRKSVYIIFGFLVGLLMVGKYINPYVLSQSVSKAGDLFFEVNEHQKRANAFLVWVSGNNPNLTPMFLLVEAFISLLFLSMSPLLVPLRSIDNTCLFGNYKTWIVYFASLGIIFSLIPSVLGNSLVTICVIPIYSVAYIFASFAIAAAVGNYFAIFMRKYLIPIMILLGVMILVFSFCYSTMIQTIVGLSALNRLASATVLVTPFGFCTGVLFTAGIRQVYDGSESAIPWMWAIFGSVFLFGVNLATVVSLDQYFYRILQISSALIFVIVIRLFLQKRSA